MFETKILPLTEAKLADDGPGRITGYASTFGNIDSYGDTIVRGAYKSTIPDFLRDGFIPWGHDWAGYPVATPDKAREDDTGLWIEAEFHTDPESQRARALVSERLARGKTMGLSIGYEAKGFDFQEMDGRQVRRLLDINLMEVSLVMVPADASARVAQVKGLKRSLNRQQMDKIIAVILEALSADDIIAEAVDDDEAGKSADPIAALRSQATSLKDATDDDLMAARERVAAMLSDLGAVRGEFEALVKRADEIGAEDPRELFRQFTRLDGLYGHTTPNGRVAVQGAR